MYLSWLMSRIESPQIWGLDLGQPNVKDVYAVTNYAVHINRENYFPT